MSKQKEIALEYGMSFERVVMSYAADGHSMTDTANMIGYNPGAFVRLCDRHGWRERFVSGQQSVACAQAKADRVGVYTDAGRGAIQAAMDANPRYFCIEHGGITDTLAGHARRAGVSYRTAYNRWRAHPGDIAHALAKTSHRRPPSDEARGTLRVAIKTSYRAK